MPLETATYISDLVVTNPANSDGLNQADDHMRLIKAAVKATFPNFTSAALSSTQANIDTAVTAQLAITARNGTVPAGAIMDFAGTTAPTGWLECNGAAVSRTTYAALFAAISTTWGAGDGSTTFNLPPDRYRRGRNAAGVAVGTLQADQNKTHTHAVNFVSAVENQGITFSFSGTTGAMNANASHTHTVNQIPYWTTNSGSGVGGGGSFGVAGTTSISINATNTDHGHAFSGTTGTQNQNHTHNIVGTTATGSADGSEARPLSATYLTCIKT